ncbi:hypothetical protein [uncultured Pseudomonas sp.]|uniref:hypothetical protein n=1 Tax=uncultured Pseudomonas sp. TaxID=114707 RepID=UPI002053C5F3|nr:hypothetical protein [uncultured Pseudomonas sp.]DAN60026.1 MAG TPA: hypothetical protein [Caudoviricetes sp.]
MQTTQHGNTRCPVYLHPAAVSSPETIERIQRSTGQLVIVKLARTVISQAPAPVIADDQGPWGGDAA